MPFMTEAQQQAIRIERMIFHVVGKEPGRPLLLDQVVAVGSYEAFFADRIRDTLKGAVYQFLPIAGTRDALARAAVGQQEFVLETQNLANRFQALYEADGRLSNGVLVILQFMAGEERLFDILKFDHDPAVGYDIQVNAGHRVAVLGAISRHFSRHKEAVQKSALVRIDDAGGGEVCAIDRSSSIDITGPFQAFLDVKRKFEHAELTTRMFNVLYRVGMKHQDDLDPDVVKSLRHRVREALTRLGNFTPGQSSELKAAVFGPLASDHPVHASFAKELERNNMTDETIEFDPQVLPRTSRLLKETREGIQVFIPEQEKDRVDFVPGDGGESYLRVRTMGLKIDDVELEKANRRRP